MLDTGKRILKKTSRGIWIATAIIAFSFAVPGQDITIAARETNTNSQAQDRAWIANTVSQVEEEIKKQEARASALYEIQWGDTLWVISEATGTSLEDLVKLNHIEHPDVIFAGDDLDGVLKLPNQGPSKGSKNASQPASNQTRPIESGHTVQIRENELQEKADVSEELKKVSEKEAAVDEPNLSIEEPVSSDQPAEAVARKEKLILEDSDTLLPKDKQALAKSAEESQTEMPIEIIKETEEESLLASQVLTREEVIQEVGNIGQNGEELRSEPIGTVTKLTEELIESEENKTTTSLTTRKEVRDQPVRYLYDNSLEKSVEFIESEGQPAYDIIQTKTVTNDLGQVLSRDEQIIESFPGHEKIIRLGTKEVEETSQIKELVQNKYIISHGREIRQTQDRYVGDDQILQVGQDGERVERLEIIKDASGQILSQTVLSSEVTKEAVTEIVEKGSRENQVQVRNDEVTQEDLSPAKEEEVQIDPVLQGTPVQSLEYLENGSHRGHDIIDYSLSTQLQAEPHLSFEDLLNESDAAKYQKAKDESYRNYVHLEDPNQNETLILPFMASDNIVEAFNNGKLYDVKKLNHEFIDLVNQERAKEGKQVLVLSEELYQGAELRAQEQANIGSVRSFGMPHIRPNAEDWSTAYEGFLPAEEVGGENTLQNYYSGNPYELISEKYLAESLFQQWLESPEHYRAMMDDSFETSSLALKMAPTKARHQEEVSSTVVVGVQAFGK